MAYKLYRRHNCQRQHKTYRVTAKCMFPRTAWVIGEGRFASLAYCRVLTVMLHETAQDARVSKAIIDTTGCGGQCRGESGHKIIEIAELGELESW